ncbi:MAG: hypothetical protein ACKKMP_00845 [Candidatus Nealsonbacteria bacterium]
MIFINNKIEYKFLKLKGNSSDEDRLNEVGKQGWELVGLINGGERGGVKAYFKRNKD